MDDRNTLEDLEGASWGEPPVDLESLHRVHRIRRTPLRDISPADIRFMLMVQQSPQHLLPIALSLLQHDPLIQSEYFPGDLLQVTLEQDSLIYKENPALRDFMRSIVTLARTRLPLLPHADFAEINQMLEARITTFSMIVGELE